MNGEMKGWSEAVAHVSSHALHHGDGVFEGIRCYETGEGAAIFRLDEHLERFYASAACYQLRIPFTQEELEEAVCETIRRNNFKSCYIRPICYSGSESLSIHPRNCPVEVVILTWPWGAYLGAGALESGVRTTISPWIKFHSRMMPTTAKGCGQYVNSILAVRDAVNRGFDEAIMLDAEGNLAEGSAENIFIVRDGRLLTNDEQSSILLGITRDTVIQMARGLGYAVEIRAIGREELLSADEAFFTGTAVEITPIREVDGTVIGSGTRGQVTARLQETFFAVTAGRDPNYRHWLRFLSPQAAGASLAS